MNKVECGCSSTRRSHEDEEHRTSKKRSLLSMCHRNRSTLAPHGNPCAIWRKQVRGEKSCLRVIWLGIGGIDVGLNSQCIVIRKRCNLFFRQRNSPDDLGETRFKSSAL